MSLCGTGTGAAANFIYVRYYVPIGPILIFFSMKIHDSNDYLIGKIGVDTDENAPQSCFMIYQSGTKFLMKL